MNKKRGQVWVETVTYTLIGLTIIGLLIAGIKPRIEESQDKSLINQIKESLETINQEINSVKTAPGNQRKFFVNIEKGSLEINPEEDSLTWVMDSRYKYSELNLSIEEGTLNITTIKENPWQVTIVLPLNLNLTYDGEETIKEFRETSTAYEFIVKNEGETIDIKNIN
ncbi:hypothetical protein CMI41_00805 [Candidatus Pacearchaeota archaeon]|nr:hypothetical protein [Candidatus Pacearchaeota archaeon]|tara:strand:+ start:6891 stop:7394 length:504 start_codon:yes stop_codon:yes gene_type:complete